MGPGVSLGVPWTSFGGPWGVVLDSLWEADAPNVTHTDVSALSVFLCVFLFVFSINHIVHSETGRTSLQ